MGNTYLEGTYSERARSTRAANWAIRSAIRSERCSTIPIWSSPASPEASQDPIDLEFLAAAKERHVFDNLAKGAASVVLTDPGLANIVALVEHGWTIYQRILTWIIDRISRSILKAAFVAIA